MANQFSGTGSSFYRSKKRRRYQASRYPRVVKEVKFFDIIYIESPILAAGSVEPILNTIVQNTGESGRIGRKVTVTSINFRYILQLTGISDAAVAASEDVVRIIVYLDKQCNGAAATVLDILETADPNSFRNLTNVNRFDLLMDRTHDLKHGSSGNDGTTGDYGRSLFNYTWFKKCGIPLEFDGATGAISEVQSNNLGALSVAHIGNLGTIVSQFRLRYTDM